MCICSEVSLYFMIKSLSLVVAYNYTNNLKSSLDFALKKALSLVKGSGSVSVLNKCRSDFFKL